MISDVLKLIMIIFLAANALKDIREHEISLPVTAASLPFGLLYAICERQDMPLGLFLSLLPGICAVALSFLTSGAVGTGDGLILCMLALYYPLSELMAVLSAALFFSAIYSGFLLLGQCSYRQSFAFVPFLLAGVTALTVLS